jgi:Flp pilus assembly protein TadG
LIARPDGSERAAIPAGMSTSHRLTLETRATALIEFALLSPILIMLLLGMLGYGQYIFAAHTLQQLANDAARAAMVGSTSADRAARARASVAANLAETPIGGPDAVTTRIGEGNGRVTVTLSLDTRTIGMMRPGMVPMPRPVIQRRAVAGIAALP